MANKGKKREAENLGDLLSTLYTQQQSGLLSIESLQNGRWEAGELYILVGQPVYARQGKLCGQEALKQLIHWRPLRFSFSMDAPRPPANLPASIGRPTMPPTTQHTLPAVASHTTGNLANRVRPSREQFVPRKVGMSNQVLAL